MAADLDPLGIQKRGENIFNLENYGIEPADLETPVTSEDIAGADSRRLGDVVALLKETYCRTIGIEYGHINDIELRSWLQHRMESTHNRISLSPEEQATLLSQVCSAQVFEQFLQTKFLGAKRFSLEGAEGLIPLLDRMITRSAQRACHKSSSAWPTAAG